jgi:hypothetical protein
LWNWPSPMLVIDAPLDAFQRKTLSREHTDATRRARTPRKTTCRLEEAGRAAPQPLARICPPPGPDPAGRWLAGLAPPRMLRIGRPAIRGRAATPVRSSPIMLVSSPRPPPGAVLARASAERMLDVIVRRDYPVGTGQGIAPPLPWLSRGAQMDLGPPGSACPPRPVAGSHADDARRRALPAQPAAHAPGPGARTHRETPTLPSSLLDPRFHCLGHENRRGPGQRKLQLTASHFTGLARDINPSFGVAATFLSGRSRGGGRSR